MYVALAGRAALEVVAEGGGFFDENVASEIEKVAGVKAAVPSVQTISALYFQKTRPRLMVLGIDPARDAAVHDYQLEEGQFFSQRYRGPVGKRDLPVASGRRGRGG